MVHNIYKKDYNLSDLFMETGRIYFGNFKKFLFVLFALYLPLTILSVISNQWVLVSNPSLNFLIKYIIQLPLFAIPSIAIAYMTKYIIDKKEITVKSIYGALSSKYFLAIGTMFFMLIMVFGLTLALIIPGIIFGVFWTFYQHAILFSEKKWMSALKYSKKIIKGNWWRVFGIILLVVLLLTVVIVIFGVILGIIQFIFGISSISQILGSFISTFASAFFLVFIAVMYINYEATYKRNLKPSVTKKVAKVVSSVKKKVTKKVTKKVAKKPVTKKKSTKK